MTNIHLLAQEPREGESPAKTWVKEISPFLAPETVAVARIRLDLLTAANALAEMQKSVGTTFDHAAFPLSELLHEQAIQTGASELVYLVQIPDYGAAPEIVVLVRMNGKISEKALARSLLGIDETQDEELKSFVIVKGNWIAVTASDETTARLQNQLPFMPRNLIAAVMYMGDDPVQLIGMLSGDTIYSIDTDQLPHSSLLMYYLGKLEFAALGISYPPTAKARLHLQLAEKNDAEELHDWLDVLTTPENHTDNNMQLLAAMFHPYVPQVKQSSLRVTLWDQELKLLRTALTPMLASAKLGAQRANTANDLKQFALAFHNFADVFKKFPPANFPKSPTGQPLLSWRVYLLPFLEQNALYEQFHLDEPWDSEHNRKLVELMPEIYSDPAAKPGLTTYVVPVGENTFYPGNGKSVTFSDILDGTSNTIMILKVAPAEAVTWTKPDDWRFDPAQPFHGLDNLNPEGIFQAAFVDGSVHTLSTKKLKPITMQHLVERNDDQMINYQELE